MRVASPVGVTLAVRESDEALLGVCVGVAAELGVRDVVGVLLRVGVREGDAVGVRVGDCTLVRVLVPVEVLVGVLVGVAVAVATGGGARTAAENVDHALN